MSRGRMYRWRDVFRTAASIPEVQVLEQDALAEAVSPSQRRHIRHNVDMVILALAGQAERALGSRLRTRNEQRQRAAALMAEAERLQQEAEELR